MLFIKLLFPRYINDRVLRNWDFLVHVSSFHQFLFHNMNIEEKETPTLEALNHREFPVPPPLTHMHGDAGSLRRLSESGIAVISVFRCNRSPTPPRSKQ